MSWFGKLLGGTVGLMIGGPLGAIAGGAIGHHLFDKGHSDTGRTARFEPFGEDRGRGRTGSTGGRSRSHGGGRDATGGTGSSAGTGTASGRSATVEERQAAYFLALFSILGKLAKADGQITREEGEMVVSFLDEMRVQGEERQFAIRVFNEAKNSRYNAQDFARQFAGMTQGQHDLRSSMMDMLFQIAMADGEYHPQEEQMIESIAAILGIGGAELDAFRSRYIGNTDNAYAVLGLSSDADDETVKSAYRQLVHEYHPDRIISQGMPQEFVEYATQRFQEIQTAWDQIKRQRNL
jgi:DnaJ like chaperone protein